MNTLSLELFLGAILPVALDFIFKAVGKNGKVKFAIALVLPLLLGIGLNYNSLSFANVDAILGSGGIIFAAAQGVYRLYFKNSLLRKKLTKGN